MFDARADSVARRVTASEVAWLGVVVILAVLSSIDAVSQIPPLADDYWMLHKPPGAIARDYLRDYGWGRPLGIAIIDLANSVRAAAGASILSIVLAVRVLTLVSLYVILRRLFAVAPGIALLTVVLIAWNPAAGEAWVLLCNLHLAVSIIGVYLACGLYARALGVLPDRVWDSAEGLRKGNRRTLLIAVITQVGVNLTYEQSLLAIPAFVAMLVAMGWRQSPASRWSRVAALAVSSGATGVSLAFMLMSGYVQSRSTASTATAAELSDLGNALGALWTGFGEHHLWRAIEAVRLRRVSWWDSSLLGVMAAIGTLGAGVAVAWRWSRDRSVSPVSSPLSIAAAAFAAAYASMFLTGLAFTGYPIFSRLFYLPGAFLAMSIAFLLHAARRGSSAKAAILVGAAVVWMGIVSRRYYEDMRAGSRMLREVAVAVARVPASLRGGGLLVIAPSNVGTFSTSGVEPWSIRAATLELTGLNPEGPIFLVTDCAELQRRTPTILDEKARAIDGRRWTGVVHYGADSVEIHSSVQSACAIRPPVGSRSGTFTPS